MKCHYCGAQLVQRGGFCLNCGTRQEAVSSAAKEQEAFSPGAKAPQILQEVPEFLSWEPEPAAGTVYDVPMVRLPTGRSLAKMIFLGILTLGIYPAVIWSRMVTELNIAASRHDGRRTMPYFAMLLLTPLTLGIFTLVWMHRFCRRIGAELQRRRLDYRFGARDFWLWNVLGCLILVGPFVFVCKLTRAMNKINRDFNIHG